MGKGRIRVPLVHVKDGINHRITMCRKSGKKFISGTDIEVRSDEISKADKDGNRVFEEKEKVVYDFSKNGQEKIIIKL